MIDRRRSFGTVTGDGVIQARGRAVRLSSSDRDHIRIVAWRGDCSVTTRSVRIVAAVVTGGDDDHDARLPGLFYCLAERIESVTLVHRMTERQVNHANVVLTFQLDGTHDRRDDIGFLTAAICIQYPQVNDIYIRRDAFECPFETDPTRVGASAAYDTGHVRSMSVAVGGIRGSNEALAIYDAGIDAVRRHQVVLECHAAIDHGYPNAGSVPGKLPGICCEYGRVHDIQ